MVPLPFDQFRSRVRGCVFFDQETDSPFVIGRAMQVRADVTSGFSSAPLIPPPAEGELSGAHWVKWADTHAPNSQDLADLDEDFRKNVEAFVAAMKKGAEEAGSVLGIKVAATFRHPRRAYLFHWSYKIGQGMAKAKAATPMEGVPIKWDHGKESVSQAKALAMAKGFGLALKGDSDNIPALKSNHTRGLAVDMSISWDKKFTAKAGSLGGAAKTFDIPGPGAGSSSTALHKLGASYGVKKLVTDKPHWSANGK